MNRFECIYDHDKYECPATTCEECSLYSCRYCICVSAKQCKDCDKNKKKANTTDAVIASAIPFDEPPF